jgi:hypothetical protein
MSEADEALDRRVRLLVYDRFVEHGTPPTVDEVAAALGVEPAAAADAFRRLEAARTLVLAPGTTSIWMANPFSAVPTPFWVESAGGAWWGSCIWDALAIPALLGEDATVSTSCGDCGEPLRLSVSDGALEPTDCVAHFAVPARRWWENIGYT